MASLASNVPERCSSTRARAAPNCNGGEDGRPPEKTRRSAASFSTIPTCRNLAGNGTRFAQVEGGQSDRCTTLGPQNGEAAVNRLLVIVAPGRGEVRCTVFLNPSDGQLRELASLREWVTAFVGTAQADAGGYNLDDLPHPSSTSDPTPGALSNRLKMRPAVMKSSGHVWLVSARRCDTRPSQLHLPTGTQQLQFLSRAEWKLGQALVLALVFPCPLSTIENMLYTKIIFDRHCTLRGSVFNDLHCGYERITNQFIKVRSRPDIPSRTGEVTGWICASRVIADSRKHCAVVPSGGGRNFPSLARLPTTETASRRAVSGSSVMPSYLRWGTRGRSALVDRAIPSGATVSQWLELFEVRCSGQVVRAIPSGASLAQWIERFQVEPQWLSG
ncbi:hypothetical protein PR048_018589 [Dryococelus australis]|uniref:Uncharacterized protein n=1 Tax=Dryococelus australis TaxID=614101 RepID=A0ABQ9HCT6_9NEOP|nr:hypothetical protein PR048_018589 [Dryococelus australis]